MVWLQPEPGGVAEANIFAKLDHRAAAVRASVAPAMVHNYIDIHAHIHTHIHTRIYIYIFRGGKTPVP